MHACGVLLSPNYVAKGFAQIDNNVEDRFVQHFGFVGLHSSNTTDKLKLLIIVIIIIISIIFWPTSTKPVGVNMKLSNVQMVATTSHSGVSVCWKETAFPL